MNNSTSIPGIFNGGGESGELIRSIRWEKTDLGPYSTWPASLTVTLGIILNSKLPMFLFWGKEHILFYNDAYIPALDDCGKHPDAMGKKGKDVWNESWEFVRVQIDNIIQGKVDLLPGGQMSHFYHKQKFNDIILSYTLNAVRNEVGSVAGVLVICNETIAVTAREQIQAQKKLETQNLELKHLFNSINEGFFSKDVLTGNYITISAGCEKIYGYSLEEFFENPLLWAAAIHPDDKQRVFKDDELHQKGEKTYTEHRIYHKDKSLKWIGIKVIPILTDGILTRIDGIINDITERKLAEQQRERMNADLIEKNINLKQFSYIVSHNLRSPINKIQGLASLFDAEGNHSENRKLIKHIVHEANNLDRVVSDLTTIVSYQDLGAHVKEEIFFKNELRLIKQNLQKEIDEAEAQISYDFNSPDRLQTVKGYFYSIMYNLLSNALKYRDPKRKCKIRLESSEDEFFICLCVKDNGLGIDLEKNRTKLFGLYNRFHDKSIPGKGMGLNLVKTQAETLGGRVEVETAPGKGAMFKVYFPKEASCKLWDAYH